MAVIRGALGDDEREGTGPRDGRGVLWDDDILNGLDENGRFDGGGDDDGPDGFPRPELPDAFLVASPHSLVLQNVGGAFVDTGQELAGAAGLRGGEVALGDLDGDGDLDAFLAHREGNAVYLNRGGEFVESDNALAGIDYHPSYYPAVALGDLDTDGDLDAVIGAVGSGGQDRDYGAAVLLNEGDGTFGDGGVRLQIDWGSLEVTNLALGDLDGDGDLDAVATNVHTVDDSFDVITFHNLGDGTFVEDGGPGPQGSVRFLQVELGDLDGDGDLDAFFATEEGFGGDEYSRVVLNDGDGTFTDTGQEIGPRFLSNDVALGDLDSDGDLDAVVAGAEVDSETNTVGPSRVFLNEGDGTFIDIDEALGNQVGRAVDLADVDADDDLDAFIAQSGGSALFLNDGDGTFTDSDQELPAAVDVALGDLIPTPRVADDDGGDDDRVPEGEALSLTELLDDGAIPVDGPADTQQPVTHDGATAIGSSPSVEDLVVAPANVVA
jgi:hypothetical protein